MPVSGVRNRPLSLLLPFLLSISLCFASGQDQGAGARKKAEAPSEQRALFAYQKWLDEDVRYIITDQERADFSKLTTDTDRDVFIIAFWERRNPNPGSQENEFKKEHYQRLAYANTHFAAGVPGWKTDRGRIYIVYGPPDEIEHHPASSGVGTPGQGLTSANDRHAYEVWRYRIMKGVGRDIFVEFDDNCNCGEYRITVDPTKKHSSDEKKILEDKI